jgi:SAM-dependent methyltransferase
VESDSLINLAERVLALDTLISQLEISQRVAVAESREALEAEIRAREAVQIDVRDLSGRIGSYQDGLERLQLGARLGRLERDRRTRAQPMPSRKAPTSAPATTSIDYLTFEARFRPEAQVREQQRAYLEVLKERKRVVDLGCGRGELIELLKEDGISAYGVDVEPDMVALARERGLEVVEEDAIAHLESLEPGAVDGVVALHVVEHLDAVNLGRLVELAADRLADGGILVLETPNPESLTAGSVNFHRDPTHVRPIHPDTLSFLCESAGFSEVEVRKLSPVPAENTLPRAPKPVEALEQHIDSLVERLNALLYGYQDYAVVAKK